MKNKWTSDQEKAINSSGGTILVSAAAGSGKTSVLVQRVINAITRKQNPVDINKLLIVTFTNAAAQEMKNRISENLAMLLAKNPNDNNLHRQQMLLKCADIGTIHSFCNTLIKENFHKLQISPNFKVATESEVHILKEKAIENTFSCFYRVHTDDFTKIMDIFGSEKSNDKLKEIIEDISKFMDSIAFPEKWVKEKLQFYDEKSIKQNVWIKMIIEHSTNILNFVCNSIEDTIETIKSNSELKEKYLASFETDLNNLKILNEKICNENCSWDTIAESVKEFSFSRLKPCKSKIKESIVLKRDYAKNMVSDLKKYFSFSSNDIENTLKETFVISSNLFEITLYYRSQIQKLKFAKNMLDFNDLERLVLKLLVKEEGLLIKSDIANEITQKYTEIMIDEYQDINEIQDNIFKLISKQESNLFIVGDVKQSIYKFRQSRPEIFLSKKNSFTLYDGKNFPAKIILDKNFRSKNYIIDCINLIFECLMSKEVGDMEYEEEDRLRCQAEYINLNENDVSLKLIDASKTDIDTDILEAREIAKTIKEMILKRYQVKHGDTYKDVTYNDFCILLRSFNSHASVYLRELTAEGIPCFSETSEKFLSTPEISTMLSFLKIIDNPIDDISLISAMISPLFGFTTDNLSEIRNTVKDAPFYFALKEYANDSLEAKKFIEILDYYRKISETMSCSELIDYIYNETQYPYMCLALSDGELRKENLFLLRDYAKKYDEESYKGLSGFLNFIKSIERKNSDLPSALISCESENSVRIMSIHKSKGLEFPICILAGCSRKFIKDNDSIVLHPNFGLGIKLKSDDGLIQYNNFIFEAISLKNRSENISEEMRILYVALTRAKQKLILVGSLKNIKKTIERCIVNQSFKIPSPQIVKNCDSFLEWIFVCLCFSSQKGKLFETLKISDKILHSEENKNLVLDIDLITEFKDQNREDENSSENELEKPIDENFLHKIDFYTKFKYPFENLEKFPVKISASKLSHSGEWQNYFASSWPAFMSGTNISPTAKGTALHKFMFYSDLKKAHSDLELEINRLSSIGLLSSQEISLLNINSIQAFLNSRLCERILSSSEILKEYKFSVRMPIKEIPNLKHSDTNLDHSIIVQGAMDCAFLEDGNYVIVDYKTDKSDGIQNIYQKYLNQLEIYKYALEKIKRISVKEVGIYSFYLSDYCCY